MHDNYFLRINISIYADFLIKTSKNRHYFATSWLKKLEFYKINKWNPYMNKFKFKITFFKIRLFKIKDISFDEIQNFGF